MAATVGLALLQAAGGAPPARLTDTHALGQAVTVTMAASRAQGETEGGIEAQQVVVGITEEVQQHLEAQRSQLWEAAGSPTSASVYTFLCPGVPWPGAIRLSLSLPQVPMQHTANPDPPDTTYPPQSPARSSDLA